MQDTREVIVPAELSGQRLDRVLAALLGDMTRSAIQRLIKDGAVLLDGQPARASDKPAAGQHLTVGVAAPRPLDLVAQDIPLDIVFADEHLLVVNKPPEMVVHPARGHQDGTLVNALLGLAGSERAASEDSVRAASSRENHERSRLEAARTGSGGNAGLSSGTADFRPGIVHRLDQHTSGLLLIARHDRAHAELSRQVEAHEVRREYQAVVWGHPQPPQGEIRTGFGRHPQHRTMMCVQEWGRGREAVTQYRTAERYRWSWVQAAGERPRERQAALVECVLQTGRTHQIRVHLQHLGHPLLNDPLYGDSVRDAQEPEEFLALLHDLPGQALHAGRLTFTHPIRGERLTLEALPPPGLSRLLDWLRLHRAY